MGKLIAVFVTALVVEFIVAYRLGEAVEVRRHPTYAAEPDDCRYAGRKATGWTTQSEYKGGINNGGMSGPVLHECK